MSRVVIAGAINMDLIGTAERLPVAGESITGSHFATSPGGKAANQAVAAARSGADTHLIGRVGRDGFGEELRLFLSANGVDISRVKEVPDSATGTALIMVGGDGENMIVVEPGVNATVHPCDFDDLDVRHGDVLVAQLEVPLEAMEVFLGTGSAIGARTIFNPSPARPCDAELFDRADLIIVNQSELAFYSHIQTDSEAVGDSELVERLVGMRTRSDQVIVVTLASEGALAVTPDDMIRLAGLDVVPVDATGAGDCFVGTLSARLARGEGLEEALKFANVAASLCVQRRGAGPSMPTSHEVEMALDYL